MSQSLIYTKFMHMFLQIVVLGELLPIKHQFSNSLNSVK